MRVDQALSFWLAVQHAPDWRRFRTGTIAFVVGLGLATAVMLPFRKSPQRGHGQPRPRRAGRGGGRGRRDSGRLRRSTTRLSRLRPVLHSAVLDIDGRQRPELAGARRVRGRRPDRGSVVGPACSSCGRTRRGTRRTRGGSSCCPNNWSRTSHFTRCSPSSPRASGAPSISRPWRCCCRPARADVSEVVASDGPDLDDESLERIVPSAGTLASLTGSMVAGAMLRQIPLAAAGGPIGLLVLRGRALDVHDRGLLGDIRQPCRARNRTGTASRRCPAGPPAASRSTSGDQRSSAPSPTTCALRWPRSRWRCPTFASPGSCLPTPRVPTFSRRSRSRPIA